MREAVLIAAMAVTTMMLRFLPFLIFRKKTPLYITYLGKVLPPAIIGMLVIYCLKDVAVTMPPFALPEIIAGAGVVGLQVWRRNPVVSILGGTGIYMVLIHLF